MRPDKHALSPHHVRWETEAEAEPLRSPCGLGQNADWAAVPARPKWREGSKSSQSLTMRPYDGQLNDPSSGGPAQVKPEAEGVLRRARTGPGELQPVDKVGVVCRPAAQQLALGQRKRASLGRTFR